MSTAEDVERRKAELIATMDAVTRRLYENKKLGKKLFQRGQDALNRKFKLADFLVFDDAANYFYRSSISYRVSSQWYLAAVSLVKCAEMHKKSGMLNECAVLYTEAAETMIKADIVEAMKLYRLSITIYCDIGRFDIAGRLERLLAFKDYDMRHWEEAAMSFRRAANYLAGDQLLDQSDYCLEKCAECYVEIGEFEEASKIYCLVAEGCVHSNLRRLTAKTKVYIRSVIHTILAISALLLSLFLQLFYAVCCLIGIPAAANDTTGTIKYAKISESIHEFEKIDFMWNNSKEVVFLENLIDARLKFEQHDFADHLYWWDNVCPFGVTELKTLRVMSQEIQAEIDRKIEAIRKEELRKMKAKIRRDKFLAKKKLMEDLGVKGKVEIDEEEVDAEAEDKLEAIEAFEHKEEKVEIGNAADITAGVLEGVVEDDESDDGGMSEILNRNKARRDEESGKNDKPARRKREQRKK